MVGCSGVPHVEEELIGPAEAALDVVHVVAIVLGTRTIIRYNTSTLIRLAQEI